MPSIFKNWTGTLAQAAFEIPLTDFDGGWCVPEVIIISGGVTGANISDPVLSLITWPGGKTDVGSDINGTLGTLLTFTNSGDYRTYATSLGNVTFIDGPFRMSLRLEVNFIDLDAIANISIEISPGFPLDTYIEDPLFLPPFGETTDPGVDDFINLGWSSSYLIPEETGFEVQRSLDDGATWDTLALVPRDPVIEEHSTELPLEVDAIYRVRAYKASNTTFSPWSTGVAAPLEDALPDLQYFPTGGMKLGTISVGEINQAGPIGFVLYSDPSGLYTIVEGQYYDRLYNRATGEYIDVAIPNPFVKTGYIP